MKTATTKDLRDHFLRVAKWIEEGESVEITRSGRPFAHLAPVTNPIPQQVASKWPDFLTRMREDFPGGTASNAMQSIIDYNRGDR